ncbi:phage tail protein [Geodermatophilus sp. SYSU D00742]
MTPPPRSVLLDGTVGWGKGTSADVGTFSELGLHLADPAGVRRLAMALPPWVAAPAWSGGGTVPADVPPALLGDDGTVRRLDPGTGTFVAVVGPADLDVAADDLSALTVSHEDVYLLDEQRARVLVVTWRGVLRAVLTPPARPVAVCGLPEGAAVLCVPADAGADDAGATVWWHRTGELALEVDVVALPPGNWARCLAGRDGAVWTVDVEASTAVRVGARGAEFSTDDGPGLGQEVLRPGVELLPDGLLLPGLSGPVDRDGRPVAPSHELTDPVLPQRGWWISDVLDSRTYRCSWHRVAVHARVAPRTRVRLSTHTADAARPAAELASLPAQEWQQTGRVDDGETDVLLLSGPGRFLWIRVELEGDGYASPEVRSLRIEFPRRSYLRFLPAVWSADAAAADFLTRFLAMPGTLLESWDALLQDLPQYVDPRTTPDRFVDLLASWLHVAVEGTWTPAQQRCLVDAASTYLARRGTRAAVRAHVAAYLTAMSGADPDDDGLPRIVEGFEQRRYLVLPTGDRQQRPLWGLGRVGRLQPDRYDQLGQVRLVADGDPQLDVFAEHAHRFAVLVPAGSAPTLADRAMLRRAIEQESPAHAQASLVLVEPAMCLGVQSQLGVDSVLAAPAPVRLVCRSTADRYRDEGEDPPVPRLGPLAVLGGPPGPDEGTVGHPPSGGGLLAVS